MVTVFNTVIPPVIVEVPEMVTEPRAFAPAGKLSPNFISPK